jgi:acetyl-CoA acetyltransferase
VPRWGQTAGNVARLKGISRAEQDAFGARSQNRAEKAIADGFWDREITPVSLPDGTTLTSDDGPRPGSPPKPKAFAAQVIPSARELRIDEDKLNVNGGAIAVGHPFGMTGARITCTLLNSLQSRDKQLGLETICVGGGQGMAMIIERL